MKIYIASPLFSEAEKHFNIKLNDFLKYLGHKTYLPQKDGGVAFELIKKDRDKKKIRNRIFFNDIEQIKKCDAMICALDGRSVDEGVCVELGIAYALGKKCIGYKTDTRSLDKYGNNLMIDGCLIKIVASEPALNLVLKEINNSK